MFVLLFCNYDSNKKVKYPRILFAIPFFWVFVHAAPSDENVLPSFFYLVREGQVGFFECAHNIQVVSFLGALSPTDHEL